MQTIIFLRSTSPAGVVSYGATSSLMSQLLLWRCPADRRSCVDMWFSTGRERSLCEPLSPGAPPSLPPKLCICIPSELLSLSPDSSPRYAVSFLPSPLSEGSFGGFMLGLLGMVRSPCRVEHASGTITGHLPCCFRVSSVILVTATCCLNASVTPFLTEPHMESRGNTCTKLVLLQCLCDSLSSLTHTWSPQARPA